jgi:hypothetical protein
MSSTGRAFRGMAAPPILAIAAPTRDLGELTTIADRYGRALAVELAAEPTLDRPREHVAAREARRDGGAIEAANPSDAPVLGLRAPLAAFVPSPVTRDANTTPRDAGLEWMSELRALRARRLVLHDGASLSDVVQARSLGRSLDALAARFQAQGFQLGFDPGLDAKTAAGSCRELVALCTEITMPGFFLALRCDGTAALLELAWGRALAPLVRQVYVPLGSLETRHDDSWARLAALANLEAIVFSTDDFLAPETASPGAARPGTSAAGGSAASPSRRYWHSTLRNVDRALAEILEKIADWEASGLSRLAPLP